MAGLDESHEAHRMSLVELQDGDVVAQATARIDLGEQRGEYSAHEVRARPVGQDLEALFAQELNDHLRRGRLAVGARHDDHAHGQLTQRTGQETGVELLDDEAGQCGPARAAPAQSGYEAGGAAQGHGDAGAQGRGGGEVHGCGSCRSMTGRR